MVATETTEFKALFTAGERRDSDRYLKERNRYCGSRDEWLRSGFESEILMFWLTQGWILSEKRATGSDLES
jgi:hypothetical protein